MEAGGSREARRKQEHGGREQEGRLGPAPVAPVVSRGRSATGLGGDRDRLVECGGGVAECRGGVAQRGGEVAECEEGVAECGGRVAEFEGELAKC